MTNYRVLVVNSFSRISFCSRTLDECYIWFLKRTITIIFYTWYYFISNLCYFFRANNTVKELFPELMVLVKKYSRRKTPLKNGARIYDVFRIKLFRDMKQSVVSWFSEQYQLRRYVKINGLTCSLSEFFVLWGKGPITGPSILVCSLFVEPNL